MKQLLLLTYFLNEKSKAIKLKAVQLIRGNAEINTWLV